jgi:hypothetical protein
MFGKPMIRLAISWHGAGQTRARSPNTRRGRKFLGGLKTYVSSTAAGSTQNAEEPVFTRQLQFGYLPFEPAAAHLLFQLVSRRYERGSILITSNRAVGDWGTVLGEQVVATAILDRLLHHSHVLTIRGDSYRLREKRRSGLIKTTPAPASAEASQ